MLAQGAQDRDRLRREWHRVALAVLGSLGRDDPPGGFLLPVPEVHVLPAHRPQFPAPLSREQVQPEERGVEDVLLVERLPDLPQLLVIEDALALPFDARTLHTA